MKQPNPAHARQDESFALPHFYPYRLAVLSDAVSRAFIPLYQERFDLIHQEWRVLAALAEDEDMCAKEIADYSTLEKMQVSRVTLPPNIEP